MAIATTTSRPTYFIPRARMVRGRAVPVRPAAARRAQARQVHRVAIAAGFGLLQLVMVAAFALLMLLGLPGALG